MDPRLIFLALASVLFLASLVYLFVVLLSSRRLRPSGRCDDLAEDKRPKGSVETGVDLRSLSSEPPQGFRKVLDTPLRTGGWQPEESPRLEEEPARSVLGDVGEQGAQGLRQEDTSKGAATAGRARGGTGRGLPEVLRSLELTHEPYASSSAPSTLEPEPEAEGTNAPVSRGGQETEIAIGSEGAAARVSVEASTPAPPSPVTETEVPIGGRKTPPVSPPAAAATRPIAPRPTPGPKVAADPRPAPRAAPTAGPAVAAKAERAGLSPGAALKPEAPDAERDSEEYDMASPVEMWFGDLRVGVRRGSKTFDEFQRLAAHLLQQMPRRG